MFSKPFHSYCRLLHFLWLICIFLKVCCWKLDSSGCHFSSLYSRMVAFCFLRVILLLKHPRIFTFLATAGHHWLVSSFQSLYSPGPFLQCSYIVTCFPCYTCASCSTSEVLLNFAIVTSAHFTNLSRLFWILSLLSKALAAPPSSIIHKCSKELFHYSYCSWKHWLELYVVQP